ncbi:hypothetical protein ACERII_17710 [Evansella sp. AB-rgal1]|uniref:hypothetical protein n=1 Tax=Evansella sp. AB-rgal1 TaxID=3242696 RepID=UPI00359CCC9F
MSNEKRVRKKSKTDHPEQFPTEEESIFDKFDSQVHVDPIPLEDVRLEEREEREKTKTKNKSSTLKK